MKQIFKLAPLLITTAMFGFGCGQSSTSSSTATDVNAPEAEKTAKVSMSFAFPDSGVEKALISDATTHILVNVKQWNVDELNNLTVANNDKALITKGTTNNATLDLLPTWTRICASQWKGDPNDTVTSTILETACTFGKLNTGANTVALSMIRGEWTLSSSFNDVSQVALSRTANNDYSMVGDVYDGDPSYLAGSGPFDMPTQAINNWGSFYNGMFNKGGVYQSLANGSGWYSNSFSATNASEPNLLIGSGVETFTEVSGDGIGNDDGICETNEICDKNVNGFVMGGFAKNSVSGLLTEEKQMINFGEVQSYDYQPGCYWNGMNYDCSKAKLTSGKTEMKIEDAAGTNVTASIVDPCQVRITGGNQIDGCAATDTSVTFGTYSTYAAGSGHKVTTTFTAKGADICTHWGEGSAAKDASGNIICVDHDYWNQPVNVCDTPGLTFDNASWRCEKPSTSNGADCSYAYDSIENVCYDWSYTQTGYTYTCWYGGTFNQAEMRCEETLAQACTDFGLNLNATYDSVTQTCTNTDITYLGSIDFTPVTMNGVGKLPASTGVSASKITQKNTIKW